MSAEPDVTDSEATEQKVTDSVSKRIDAPTPTNADYIKSEAKRLPNGTAAKVLRAIEDATETSHADYGADVSERSQGDDIHKDCERDAVSLAAAIDDVEPVAVSFVADPSPGCGYSLPHTCTPETDSHGDRACSVCRKVAKR